MASAKRIDNRVQSGKLLFAVFLLESTLRRIALTRDHPSADVAGLRCSATADGLEIDGTQVSSGVVDVEGHALLIADMARVSTQYVVFNPDDDVLFGNEAEADVRTGDDSKVIVHGSALVVYAGSRFTYLNDDSIEDHVVLTDCPVGTRVLTPDFLLERREDQWRLSSFDGALNINAQTVLEQHEHNVVPSDFPDYLRSPRVNLEVPTDKITVNSMPRATSFDRNGLLKSILPPLAMVAASVAMSVFSGRDPLMMMGMGFVSLVTAVFTCTQYFADKKETRAHNADMSRNYDQYLLSTVAGLQRLHDRERFVLDYRYPSPAHIQTMIRQYDIRTYERMLNSKDFLRVSFGQGDVPSGLNVQTNTNSGLELDSHADNRARNIAARFAVQHDAPIAVDLADTTLGLVGSDQVTTTAVANLLLQIAFFHSYHDVNFVTLVSQEDYRQVWSAWRFLPHLKMQRINTRGVVHNARTRDMVLNSFLQTVKQRRISLREAGKEPVSFSPHFVLSIMDDSYLVGHGLNEFLAEDMSSLGVSVIWCKEDKGLLPETVDTLVEYTNQGAGHVVNDHGQYVNIAFRPYEPLEQVESSVRRLSNLHHREVEKNAIPTVVDFMGLYKARTVEDLHVLQRWQGANTAQSLAVPLGMRGKDDIEELNLHERAHGPHGLIAGTTGSGKSEILQSYILSLAVNFAPEDVGFLTIDFKGGGMANLFRDLPHLMGAITNLDGAGTVRALASIDAELKKRQRLFTRYHVNSINGYTTLYKLGQTVKADPEHVHDEESRYPVEPLPHVFLICDEFAELKSNQPEFIDALVSTARIGRSLGVHLILATQKPSGVVTDQIWSNSRFKIALKVADTSDSNEIIKTPDAASISEPGRAYLQVGNNEIYELFQSAWSGATYEPNKSEARLADERVYRINELGQYELMSQDLSQDGRDQRVSDEPEAAPEPTTQLDAVVTYLAQVAQRQHATIPARPWLPALSQHYVLPGTGADVGEHGTLPSLSTPIGILDIPWKQQQHPFMFDVDHQSHTAVFGASGYGKTMLVTTLLLGLSQRYTPDELRLMLFDFSHNGLLPLQGLPHTADRIGLDEVEKLRKALHRVRETIENRNAIFKKQGAASLEQYEQRTGTRMPRLIVVVDGYDALGQDTLHDDIDGLLTSVLREGAAVGMYLIVTANRVNAIRSSLLANIPTRIALYLNDEYDVQALFGRSRQMQADIPGRAQMLVDGTPTLMQCYLPIDAENDTLMLSQLELEVEHIDQEWSGARPEAIPMVPEQLGVELFNRRDDVSAMRAAGGIPLGLAYGDAKVRGIEMHGDAPLTLMAYADEDQLALWQRIVESALAASGEKVEVVDLQEQFAQDKGSARADVQGFTMHTSVDDVQDILMLLSTYEMLAAEKRTGDPMTLVIADLASFVSASGLNADDVTGNIRLWHRAGLHLMVFSPHSYIAKSYDPMAKAIRAIKWEGVVSARVYDSALLQASGAYAEPVLAGNESYAAYKGGVAFTKIRLPQDD